MVRPSDFCDLPFSESRGAGAAFLGGTPAASRSTSTGVRKVGATAVEEECSVTVTVTVSRVVCVRGLWEGDLKSKDRREMASEALMEASASFGRVCEVFFPQRGDAAYIMFMTTKAASRQTYPLTLMLTLIIVKPNHHADHNPKLDHKPNHNAHNPNSNPKFRMPESPNPSCNPDHKPYM